MQNPVVHSWAVPAALTALIVGGLAANVLLHAQAPAASQRPAASPANPRAFIDTYCLGCHNDKLRTSGLSLEKLDVTNPGANAEVWERVIGKLRSGSMPPAGMPRPNAEIYRTIYTTLENEIDRAWAAKPNPGRIGSVHRLNRAEYGNAIRDLFGLKVDVASLLPGDDTADGSFDNFADTLSISTVHLERYMSVARQVSRLATGLPPARPGTESWEVPKFVVQKDRMSEDLPLCRPRRFGDSLQLPRRWRIRCSPSPEASVSGLPARHGLEAASGDPAGRQAPEALLGRWRR